jgi:hypothetical protein
MDIDFEELNKAIVLYIGIEDYSFPNKDEARLIKEFGTKKGEKLLKCIALIFDEINSIKFNWEDHTLISANDFVCEMAKKYPKLSESARFKH